MKAALGSSILISTHVIEKRVHSSRLNTFSGYSSKPTSLLKWSQLAYSFSPQSPSFVLSCASLFALSGKSLIIPPSVTQVKQLNAVLNMSSDYPQRTNEIRTDLVSLDAHVFACSFSSFRSPLTKETKSCRPPMNFFTAFGELTWAQSTFLPSLKCSEGF